MPDAPPIVGDWVAFDLREGSEAHMPLKRSASRGRRRCARYTFDGVARTVEGSVAKVSLLVMSAGGTWSSQSD